MGHIKRSGWLGLIFVFASFVVAGPVGAGLGEGDSVGAFSLEKSGGGTFQYPEDAKGKVVFLNFWASWCPECKVELPELVDIQEKYEDRSFVLLAVNMDRKRKSADKFLKKVGLDIMVLFDNEQKVINTFAPVGVPASYLIGPTGKVEKVYIGFKKDYIEKYVADIEALLEKNAGTAPSSAGGTDP
jgi:peroxiredoxin